MTGFKVPAAKGATVSGISAAATNLYVILSVADYPIEGGALAFQMPNDSFHAWAQDGGLALGHLLEIS